jgi:DNA modification methylase
MREVAINKLSLHYKLIDSKSNIDFSKMVVLIREFGFKTSIIVVEENNQLFIVDGARRWYAAKQLELDKAPIEVITLDQADVLIESILRNSTTKRSYKETINAIKLVLGINGSSQGKKRTKVNDLFKDDYGDSIKDRFELAGKILDIDMSRTLIRNLLKIDEFDSTPSNGFKGSLIDMMENEGITISRAFEIVERVNKESKVNDELVKELKAPIVSDNYKIHHLDNKKAESVLKENSNDLQFSSPDYFKARNYRGVSKKDQVGQLDLLTYIEELVKLSIPFKNKILKETGVFIYNVSDIIRDNQSLAIPQRLTLAMIDAGWHFIQEIKWVKDNPNPISKFRGFRPSTESFLVFAKNPNKFYWRELRVVGDNPTISVSKSGLKFVVDSPNKRLTDYISDKHVIDLVQTPGFNRKEFDEIDPSYKHQAPQNELIPLNFILHYTDIGMNVCDLFGGSGSTGAAALKHGRNVITFDLDPKNIEFMSKRFERISSTEEKCNSIVHEESFLRSNFMSNYLIAT